jgi:hypothetical protein
VHIRILAGLSLVAAALPAVCESNPSWWSLAPVDATAVVGIQWQNLKSSPFADAIWGELSSDIGLPPLPCLADARQILIASPALVAMITGNFNPATVRAQAVKLGMKAATYQGVNIWLASGKSGLGIAQLSDQLLLAGSRTALVAAVDRSLAERRHYAPVLSRAARYSRADLFVVTDRLPDPLASVFVPLDLVAGAQTGAFEGYVTVGDGLALEASLDAGAPDKAETIGTNLRQSIPLLPAVVRGLEVHVDGKNVFLSLKVEEAEFASELRAPATAASAVPQAPQTVAAAPLPPAPIAAPVAPPAPVVPPALVAPPVPPVPAGPQVIRIFGLEEGPREIVLPPAKPDKQEN